MARSSLLLTSLCAAASLAAQDSSPNEEMVTLDIASLSVENTIRGAKDRVAILEEQMQELLTDTSLGSFGAKAAAAVPQIDSHRFFVKADGFLWKAFIGGSDYAINSNETTLVIGDTKRADFRWRWGVRAELGVRLPHDQWDAVANYTWFNDKSDRSLNNQPSGNIFPLLYLQNDLISSASIRWHLLYQNFDLELRKAYFVNRHFSLSPFFGMRNSWIDQGYHTRYVNDTEPSIDVYARQDFWGIGPLAGLSSEWHFTDQWMIFGSFNGALLASNYDISSKVLENSDVLDNIKANTQRMSPTVQGALGFGWQMNFNRQRNHIALRLFYEAQYWWKQNLTVDYTNVYYPIARNGEDLGFHGCTLDMLFDF